MAILARICVHSEMIASFLPSQKLIRSGHRNLLGYRHIMLTAVSGNFLILSASFNAATLFWLSNIPYTDFGLSFSA